MLQDRKISLIRLFVLSIAAIMVLFLVGCASVAPNYEASYQNNRALKDAGVGKVALGPFDTGGASSPTFTELSIRGGSMTSPYNNSYVAYLAEALKIELTVAGLLDAGSQIKVSGSLLENSLDASGSSVGKAAIKARFVVRSQTEIKFDKVIAASDEWESSFVGGIAIPRAREHYASTVQKLLNTLFINPEFRSAITLNPNVSSPNKAESIPKQVGAALSAPTTTNAPPLTLAVPATVVAVASETSNKAGPQTGEEWEYLAVDNLFGKQKKILWKVLKVDASGVLEVLQVDGKPDAQFQFGSKADLVAAPIESGFFFGSQWDGQDIPTLRVRGQGDCVARFECEVKLRKAASERITVPAGAFDAIRYEGSISVISTGVRYTLGKVSVWYSERERRLLKQIAQYKSSGIGIQVDETVALQRIKPAQ